MPTTALRKWAKQRGLNPNIYSYQELMQLRQQDYERKHNFEWNKQFEIAFKNCCKRNGFKIGELI